MSRRRRSLLGDKKRKPGTVLPAGPRSAGPPKPGAPGRADEAEATDGVEAGDTAAAPESSPEPEARSPAEPDAAPHPEQQAADDSESGSPAEEAGSGAEAAESADSVAEDDEPLIGSDLTVPPAEEGEDEPAAPREVVAHLHTRPPEADEGQATPSEPPSDEDLVLFDERPQEDAPDPEPVITVDEDDGEPVGPTPAPAPEQPSASAPLASNEPDFTPDEESFFALEDGDPPTEEAPAGMLADDFASLYSAPTDVPDAPLMPEILGADTPAPAGGGYRPVQAPSAPSAPEVTSPRGLWDETPHPSAGRSPEPAADAPVPSKKDGTPPPPVYRQREAPAPSQDELPFWKDTWFLVAIAFAILAAIIVLIFFSFFAGPLGNPQPPQPAPMRSRPVAPDVSPPPVDLVPRDEAPAVEEESAPEDAAGTAEQEGTAPSSSPLVQPRTAPADTPTAVPTRSPTPSAPATASPTPAGRTGRLKIRATRRTLIYVNGKPVGLTPLDLDKVAGKYEISAEVDGQKRVEKVDLASGTIRLVEF